MKFNLQNEMAINSFLNLLKGTGFSMKFWEDLKNNETDCLEKVEIAENIRIFCNNYSDFFKDINLLRSLTKE